MIPPVNLDDDGAKGGRSIDDSLTPVSYLSNPLGLAQLKRMAGLANWNKPPLLAQPPLVHPPPLSPSPPARYARDFRRPSASEARLLSLLLAAVYLQVLIGCPKL